MSMVRINVGGVDIHADQHVVAAIDANGGVQNTARALGFEHQSDLAAYLGGEFGEEICS